MSQWADISLSQFRPVPLSDSSPHWSETPVKCPLCRTSTTSTPHPTRDLLLRSKYPETYRARQLEDSEPDELMTLALCVGNTHHQKNPGDEEHEWTFFVRPERTDFIDEVQINLVSSSCGGGEADWSSIRRLGLGRS
jgi:hypothetical protein